jgi:sodium/potassium-transporting ATPase subunit alpha
VAALAIVTGVVSFSYWAGSLRINHPGFLDLPTMIVNCISLIVAYVPLGLPVSVTLTLSLIAAKLGQSAVPGAPRFPTLLAPVTSN